MEIRLHGRGGQGGVTCAKILAAVYARLGKSVQAFGDYAGERSGAPIRAYTRVAEGVIANRNKVYEPDHLVVLDPTLLTDQVVSGLAPGGTLLLNTPQPPAALVERFPGFRVATLDATAIARKHGIGTRSVVIVNTTIAGAFARLLDIPFAALAAAYEDLGFEGNLPAAQEAHDAVQVALPADGASVGQSGPAEATSPWGKTLEGGVIDLVKHVEGPAPALKTGAWRSQTPQYVDKLAPCNASCPAGNDVVEFVQAIVRGDEEGAAEILGRTTPLAAICGRVCPGFCMVGCNREEYDGAVNIRALERWVADRHPVASRKKATPGQVRRFAIVGSGPAGLSAAYILALAGHEVVLLEAEPELGGVLRTGIPVYRLPREVLNREVDGIVALGVEARCGESVTAERVAALASELDAVILATGLQRLRGLTVAGADLPGVQQGIKFLHQLNFGGDSTLSGHVVVLGGGNTAMDCARSALRCGADEVTVAYRRTRAEMPAIAEEIEAAHAEGVVFLFQRSPNAFGGETRVEWIELAEVEMGPPDDSGRRRPIVTDRVSALECDHVVLALGQSADLALLPSGWELKDRRIEAEGSVLNVFAAGDVSTGDGTVTHAIGDGRHAALLALQALGEEVDPLDLVRPGKSSAVAKAEVRFAHFAPRQPADEQRELAVVRIRNFEEVNRGLAEAVEASRCFSCGRCTSCDTCLVYCPDGIVFRAEGGGYVIGYEYCKGCGICVAECPRGAMEMVAS